MDLVHFDENTIQRILSFLETQDLLRSLRVSRTWHSSIRNETWKISCRDQEAFQAVETATGLDARTIACGLYKTSREGCDTLGRNYTRASLQDQSQLPTEILFFLIQVQDQCTNQSLSVCQRWDALQAVRLYDGSRPLKLFKMKDSLAAMYPSLWMGSLPRKCRQASLQVWQQERTPAAPRFDFGCRERLNRIQLKVSLWRTDTRQVAVLLVHHDSPDYDRWTGHGVVSSRAQYTSHVFMGTPTIEQNKAHVSLSCIVGVNAVTSGRNQADSQRDPDNATGWWDDCPIPLQLDYCNVYAKFVDTPQDRDAPWEKDIIERVLEGLDWQG